MGRAGRIVVSTSLTSAPVGPPGSRGVATSLGLGSSAAGVTLGGVGSTVDGSAAVSGVGVTRGAVTTTGWGSGGSWTAVVSLIGSIRSGSGGTIGEAVSSGGGSSVLCASSSGVGEDGGEGRGDAGGDDDGGGSPQSHTRVERGGAGSSVQSSSGGVSSCSPIRRRMDARTNPSRVSPTGSVVGRLRSSGCRVSAQ